MVTTQIFTKQGQKSVLRIYGNGEVLVEDIFQYLSALEQAYNSLYVFDSLAQQAREIAFIVAIPLALCSKLLPYMNPIQIYGLILNQGE